MFTSLDILGYIPLLPQQTIYTKHQKTLIQNKNKKRYEYKLKGDKKCINYL